MKKAIREMNSLDYYNQVYPQFDNKTAPQCIFIPSKDLVRKMFRALARFGREKHGLFFLRFGLLEKHPTYII